MVWHSSKAKEVPRPPENYHLKHPTDEQLQHSYIFSNYFNLLKEIKVENGVESAKIVTNVQTFRDCVLLQWNVR